MRKSQVLDVKSVVKAQNGLLWTKFEDEAWRKTVLRRGIKTVPSVPDALTRIISRDDDQYDLDHIKTVTAPPAVFAIPDESEVLAPAAVNADAAPTEPTKQPQPAKRVANEPIPDDDDGWPGPK